MIHVAPLVKQFKVKSRSSTTLETAYTFTNIELVRIAKYLLRKPQPKRKQLKRKKT